MLDFITNLGGIPVLVSLIVAVLAVVWSFIYGAAKLRKGIEIGQAKAELQAIKKDVTDANKMEVAADAARANDGGGLPTDERLTALGRVRKPKNPV